MADAGDDLFLFGDDFEAILDLLDEDEALQEQFSTVASEVSANYINIHPYLVCHASQKTVNETLIRRFR